MDIKIINEKVEKAIKSFESRKIPKWAKGVLIATSLTVSTLSCTSTPVAVYGGPPTKDVKKVEKQPEKTEKKSNDATEIKTPSKEPEKNSPPPETENISPRID
jgi:hypothetical protein